MQYMIVGKNSTPWTDGWTGNNGTFIRRDGMEVNVVLSDDPDEPLRFAAGWRVRANQSVALALYAKYHPAFKEGPVDFPATRSARSVLAEVDRRWPSLTDVKVARQEAEKLGVEYVEDNDQ